MSHGLNFMDKQTEQTPQAVGSSDGFGGLRPLAKGDTVQRGDIFIDDGRRFEMDTRGFLLGVRCIGQVIRKENGGWFRAPPNAKTSRDCA
jgi:hypothetical protein